MDISKSRQRDLLSVDANRIVWQRHATGQYIGFRKTGATSGTWWSRLRDPATGKQHYQALGEFAHIQPAKRYDAALESALAWFQQANLGVTPHRMTVQQVCADYVSAIRRDNQKKADRTAVDFRRLVDEDPIAGIELSKLRRIDIERWRDRISLAPTRVGRGARLRDTPRAKATINRDLVPLRAALNRALDNGLIASNTPWRLALQPIKNADRRRMIYLSREDRRNLLAKADAEVVPFLRALTMLPLRPGALASFRVRHFNSALDTLVIGLDKDHRERYLTLPKTASAFFQEQCKGKLPEAPIFAQADGRPWDKDAWKDPIKDAVLAAGLPPGATAYTLRHSTITDLVTSGLDLLTIAQISGTSVAMIEKHYGHLRQEHASAALAALAL